MRKINLNKTIGFSRCKVEGYQRCSYCGEFIGKGNIALSIRKICSNPLNVWIHIGCIKSFCKDIIKFQKENYKEILAESIELV